MANNPVNVARSASLSVDALMPIPVLTVGTGVTNIPLIVSGAGNVSNIQLGYGSNSNIGYYNTYNQFRLGAGYIQIPISVNNSTSLSASPILVPNQIGSTVNGSTSGTATFTQVSDRATYKKVMVYCAALNGTANYTFPTAFVNTPVVLNTSGLAASTVTGLSTTAVTVTGSGTTGVLILEGY